MQGLMMSTPLLISSLIEHASRHNGDAEIVSRRVEGDLHRTTWREVHRRAKRLANALIGLGVQPGDRVATIAWNGYRHLELYYAVSGIGAVLHTINPRLHADQIAWIVNHAEDGHVFFDATFLPIVQGVAARCPTVRAWVEMVDSDRMPTDATGVELQCYEDLIDASSDHYLWPTFDENTASSLCYTSGTTGNPKGVLYSHRSTVIHSIDDVLGPDVLGMTPERLRSCPWCRCSTPMPGASSYARCAIWSAPSWSSRRLRSTAGQYLRAARQGACDLERPACRRSGSPCIDYMKQEQAQDVVSLRRTLIGGSGSPPYAMISHASGRSFECRGHRRAWGMTRDERRSARPARASDKGERDVVCRGRAFRDHSPSRATPVFGCRHEDRRSATGNDLPWDGKQSFGDLGGARSVGRKANYFKGDGGDPLVMDDDGTLVPDRRRLHDRRPTARCRSPIAART